MAPRPRPVAARPRLARPWLTPALAVALGVLWGEAADGSVFKCAGEGGAPVYQEAPCQAGRELRNFSDDPPPLSVIPGRATGSVRSAPADPRDGGGTDARPVRDTKAAKPAKPARDAGERRHVRTGMSQGEVLARLGEPDTRAGGRGNRHARWTYLPAPGDPETITTLFVANGVLVEVDRKVVKK